MCISSFFQNHYIFTLYSSILVPIQVFSTFHSKNCCFIFINRSIFVLTVTNRLFLQFEMGVSRDSMHKRRATGGRRPMTRKKRAFLKARPQAMTSLKPERVHNVRTRGGNVKYRALRLDQVLLPPCFKLSTLEFRDPSPGPPRLLPESAESSTLSTTLRTTSLSEPRLSSRAPSSPSIQPHSDR